MSNDWQRDPQYSWLLQLVARNWVVVTGTSDTGLPVFSWTQEGIELRECLEPPQHLWLPDLLARNWVERSGLTEDGMRVFTWTPTGAEIRDLIEAALEHELALERAYAAPMAWQDLHPPIEAAKRATDRTTSRGRDDG